jgi:signal transduction histidine kinase
VAQREYLISMTCGDYGRDYALGRLEIGRVHDRVGLDPEWYLGAYGLYLELLSPLIQERFAADPARVGAAIAALGKLILLDMQLIQDAYYGLQRKRAVEQSEQLAAVGELAASIAHEVRNPLAGMKGALQVLRKELAIKPSNLEIVDELLAQIGRLEHLVRDLLDYAQPRALSWLPFDLHEMLDRLVRMVKEQSDAYRITVQRIDGPGTGELVADPKQIEQVVLNLIHNAIQAMEEGGTLTVTTCADGDRMVITFRDTGKGIAPTELRKIFQPFYTTKHRGSGLGLPIVMKIAEAHGGSIQIESEPGQGTIATLRLPRRPRDGGQTVSSGWRGT